MPWSQAAVIIATILVVGTLAVLNADTTAVMTVVLIVLAGMGYGQLSAIREQTNGSSSRLLEEVAEHRRILGELAKASHPAPPPAAEPTPAPPPA